MEDILDQNREAERIFRQYGKLLTAVAAAQLPGRPEDAEECVQDAVWAFVEGREKWDPERGSEKTWLCLLLRSRARDRRRALASRAEEPLEDHVHLTAGDEAEGAAVRDGLRRALGELSREERRLFTLRFVYGLPSAELGGVLGLSPNGVDARVSRLRMGRGAGGGGPAGADGGGGDASAAGPGVPETAGRPGGLRGPGAGAGELPGPGRRSAGGLPLFCGHRRHHGEWGHPLGAGGARHLDGGGLDVPGGRHAAGRRAGAGNPGVLSCPAWRAPQGFAVPRKADHALSAHAVRRR